MSSGVNVVEIDWVWECSECRHNNDGVTAYFEGDVGNAICEACNHETEVQR